MLAPSPPRRLIPPVSRALRFVAASFAVVAVWGCDSLLTPSVYGSLQVKVTRRDGTPVPGVPVTAYFISRNLAIGTTDSAGTYTFRSLPAGSYGVFDKLIPGYSRPEIVRAGPPTDHVDKIQVVAGGTATADLTLLKEGPGTITARVTETGGAGVPGIAVSLYSGGSGVARQAVTDASGSFSFTDVPFGNWGISAVKSARYLDSAEAPVVYSDGILVDEGSLASAPFTFVPCAGTVLARVTDNLGHAVAGARLAVYHAGQDVDSAATDSAGAHTFTGLACQDIGVRLAAVPIGWTLVAGRGASFVDGIFIHRNASRTAALRPQYVACRGALRISVTDNAGAAVAGAQLVVYTGGVAYRTTTTPASGVATVVDLPCDHDWGVYVTPPAGYTVASGPGQGYFDGITFTDRATVNRTFVLSRP